MAKVDQTKANALLRAARTMSLGANKNTIRILYGNHVAENIDFELVQKQNSKKVSGAGANAQITAELFLLLLMSQLTILVLIQ